ncbi:MAG: response regulator [Cellulosilyticaceae bacterium]
MMYKILIVDDEKIIRIGLQSIINWEELGCKVIGVASDGVQALKTIEEEQVDVVITDIKMPNMDGISLTKELKARKFQGEIIMLTNYGEFEMARDALRYGVHDYLLKATLRPEEIEKTVITIVKKLENRGQLSQKIDIETKSQKMDKEDLDKISEVFRGVVDKEELHIKEELKSAYRFMLIRRVQSKYEKQNQENKLLSSYEGAILNIVREIVSLEREVNIFYHGNWAIYILPKTQLKEKEKFIKTALQIQNHIKMYTNVKVITVIGETFMNTQDFGVFLSKCIKASKLVYYKGYQNVILQEEGGETNTYKTIPHERFASEFKQMLDVGGYDDAIELTKEFLNHIKELRLSTLQVDEFLNKLMNDMIIDYGIYLDKDKGKLKEIAIKYRQCTTLDEIKEVLGELIYTICSYILQVKDMHYRKEVVEIIEYINQNVDKKITLSSLSEEVNMNESYISRLFKNETGTNIVNYINMIKMEKAKELLRQPDMIVKDVANALGFEEQSYFNRMFKKYFGLNPKEYKKIN